MTFEPKLSDGSNTEIERRFLILNDVWLPELRSCKHEMEIILQGYIAPVSDGTKIRLRRNTLSNTYFFTAKNGEGLCRQEIEEQVSKEFFEKFWLLVGNRHIMKRRFFFNIESGVTIEIDEYLEHFNGLVVAEIEFPSLEAANQFESLPCFDQEITNDQRFSNSNLAAISDKPEEIAKIMSAIEALKKWRIMGTKQ